MRSDYLLLVAIQCPYSGGAAVSSARAFIHLLNDTLEYDDDAICSVMGIFRMQSLQNGRKVNSLKVLPNPSSGINQLIFSGLNGHVLNVEIIDALGKLVFTKKIQSSSNSIQLNLNELSNGMYYVKLSDQDGVNLTEKILLNK